jgi:hypothetical protein
MSRAILIASLLVLTAVPQRAEQRDAEINERILFYLLADEYISPGYTDPPKDDRRLIFEGEKLPLRIHILNQGEMSGELRLESAPFRITGLPVSVQPRISQEAFRHFRGSESAEPAPLASRLEPEESLTWDVDISTESWPAGLYDVELKINGQTGRGGRLVSKAGLLRLEVREARPEDHEEIVLRAAERLYLSGHFDEAETSARTMLKEYPDSALGWSLLANIFTVLPGRVDDRLDAKRHFLEIIETGREKPFLKWRRTPVTEIISNTRQEITELSRSKK